MQLQLLERYQVSVFLRSCRGQAQSVLYPLARWIGCPELRQQALVVLFSLRAAAPSQPQVVPLGPLGSNCALRTPRPLALL